MATKAADLYDEDFYAWTQQQAEVLRTHFQGDNRLDVEHLAEEVEDLGKSELHAVESYVENIIAHLLKLDYSGRLECRGITGEPRSLRSGAASQRKITPRIRQQVEAELEELYRARANARRPARASERARLRAAAARSAAPTIGARSGTATSWPRPVSTSPLAADEGRKTRRRKRGA